MVVLDRENRSAWLDETDNEADLVRRPLPAGSLAVERVRI
jgi:putative SOS response-associated peptidase YedK